MMVRGEKRGSAAVGIEGEGGEGSGEGSSGGGSHGKCLISGVARAERG